MPSEMQTPAPFFKRASVYITSKIIAICTLGFVLTNSLGIFLSFVIPGTHLDIVIWITVLAFLFYSGLIMWVFHEKSLKVIWLSLSVSVVLTIGASSLIWWGTSQ